MCYQRLWRDGVQIMKKLFLILAFFSASAFAQSDDVWHKYGESTTVDFFLKIGSFETTKEGGRIIQKAQFKDQKEIRFRLVEMKSKECKQGFGFVYYYSLDGKFVDKLDYVENGGTIAQDLATSICNVMKNQKTV
jgi:hypothetical protein